MYDHPEFNAHESVSVFHDKSSGVTVFIALHDTSLGPALGGVRMMNYKSSQEAMTDVLRLSGGMTAKNAMANIPRGGGKAVIVGDPKTQKTRDTLLFYADCVQSLDGRFISGQDIGIVTADVDVIRTRTEHTSCTSDGGAGNPSPATSFGVFQGIKAALLAQRDTENLEGVKVAVQGLGNVGYGLAELLSYAGAKLIVADPDDAKLQSAVEKLDATVAPLAGIHKADADVFAPCALGAILNAQTIPEIKATIVAGAANNQLANSDAGSALAERGILYAPDYVINAGGGHFDSSRRARF